MWQIISGSLLLSLVHAAIPNHWLPIVAIGKSERWTMRETLNATVLIGAAHIASTIIIGVLIGLAGFRLSSNHAELAHWIAPVVLAVLGLIFIASDFIGKGHRHHNHFDETGGRSKRAIVGSMVVAMFFSPCIELEVYFLPAGAFGWSGILTTSAIYLFATVSTMLLLVYVGTKGLSRLNWHIFEHHQKTLTGVILIALAALAFIID
jgi:putative Mn2+ efflux pump MntP